MGQNLALNMERNGFTVVAYNRTQSKLDAFLEGAAKGKRFLGCADLARIGGMLEKPRIVLLMVTAGGAVDDLIETLLAHLEPGDIIIDGGNSLYTDTARRMEFLESKGLLFIGTGVSGGEEGALRGPSIMPGGSAAAWPRVQPILQKIAARTADGTPCCDWIGKGGAGHFVKMVHNGIEYADEQLICEAYFLMRDALGMPNDEIAGTFRRWNTGDLDSYLIAITADILTKRDPETGKAMVDVILDAAGQKGTGKWTIEAALDLGVPASGIGEAVFARHMSALKTQRVAAGKAFRRRPKRMRGDASGLVDAIRDALYASKLCAYAQGFALMKAASEHYDWGLNYGRIALLWREGCIIRARFLDRIKAAYDRDPVPTNLLLDPFFKQEVQRGLGNWRKVVMAAVRLGYAVPGFSSALAYFDGYTCARLPANLLQAQRDYFGAHTYERVDKEGVFHSEWLKL
jgi:6-phosphogluconate dehydrogenase